jgi:multiple sugar transport system substrate-binding protein
MRRGWPYLLGVLVLAATGCSGGSGPSAQSGHGGPVSIVMWQPYTGGGARFMNDLAATWNKAHPRIHVTMQSEGNSDYALQKVETAIAGGSYPNIAYLYGSWAANIASTPKAVSVNSYIRGDPGFHWNDFWPAERRAATVKGKIIGIPALVDNLAVMYNKTLFRQARLPYPSPGWTWDQFRADARALTDPAKKVFGVYFPADGTENTSWQFEAMLWEAGGNILNPADTRAVFNSPAGVRALSMLGDMANADHSLLVDTSGQKGWGLFNSGKLGLYITGPWDEPGLTVNYGVAQMPSFTGSPGGHQTISGPDNWVIFDHGAAVNKAAFEFLAWMTQGANDLRNAMIQATLPIRQSELGLPAYRSILLKKWPEIGVWVQNEHNAVKARPVTPLYPKVSADLANAVVSVLLGRSQPGPALNSAAQQANAILAGGG